MTTLTLMFYSRNVSVILPGILRSRSCYSLCLFFMSVRTEEAGAISSIAMDAAADGDGNGDANSGCKHQHAECHRRSRTLTILPFFTLHREKRSTVNASH